MDRSIFHFLFLVFVFVSLLVPASLFAQVTGENNPNQSVVNSRFRISVDGGLGYLIGSTKTSKAQMRTYGISNQEADRYYSELKLGEQAGASVHYMIKPDMGVGLDYNIFTTSSQVMGYLDPADGWTKYYGPFKEKIYTSFAGISYIKNQKIGEKWTYYGKLSVGMAFYRNEGLIIVAPLLITGSSPALLGESGLSYSINRNISVGISISDMFSMLRKITMNNGLVSSEVKLDNDSRENLSRLNLSTGFQFHF